MPSPPPSSTPNDEKTGIRLLGAATYLSILIARHTFAFIVSVATACVLWTIVYFALLAWAVIANSDIGGPLSYPAGLLFVAAASSLANLVLLLPSTIFAEWTSWLLRWPVLLQIPLSIVWLAILSIITLIAVTFYDSATTPTLEEIPRQAGLLILSMLLPLSLYWWAAQGPIALLDLMGRIWRRVTLNDTTAPRSNTNYTSNRHRTHGYTPGESLVTKKAPKRGDD